MMTSRLWLPAVFGLIAAAGSYTVLSRATTTHTLLALKADVKLGEPIQEHHLYAVPVRGGRPLFEGGIAYDQRDAVYGKTVRRPVKAGELLLRADVENHDSQVDLTLLRDGETTLTLPARLSAVDSRPVPGYLVMLVVRQTGSVANSNPLKAYGRFRFLGWSRIPNGRESDLIAVSVAVPSSLGLNEPELRTLQLEQAPDRLVKVEIVGTK